MHERASITFKQLDESQQESSGVGRVDNAETERVDRLDPALQLGGRGGIDRCGLERAARVRELDRGEPIVVQQSEQLLEQLLQVRLRHQLRHGLTGATRVETDTEQT